MARLPKSIIKKYGISKKAWAVYRGHKTRKKTRKNLYSVKRGIKQTMARRKRKTYRKTTSGLKPTQVLIGGGLYGAVRRYVDGWVKPITSKIPLGSIADEAVLFSVAYLLNKKMKDKTIKSVTMAGMAVEAARMGEAFSDGTAFRTSSNNGAGVTFGTLG